MNEQQMQQIVQMVAEGIQGGVPKEEIMSKLTGMGLSPEEAEAIISDIAQQMQAQQEQQAQQPANNQAAQATGGNANMSEDQAMEVIMSAAEQIGAAPVYAIIGSFLSMSRELQSATMQKLQEMTKQTSSNETQEMPQEQQQSANDMAVNALFN